MTDVIPSPIVHTLVAQMEKSKQYGEYRTRRLVLEAWDRLEGVEIGSANVYGSEDQDHIPAQSSITISPEKKKSQPVPVPEAPNRPSVKEQPAEEKPAQPSFTDFGLCKCAACGKMVMGFDRENHVREEHRCRDIEWKKVK